MASNHIQELLDKLAEIRSHRLVAPASSVDAAHAKQAARLIEQQAAESQPAQLPENLEPETQTPFDPDAGRVNIGGFPGSGLIENVLGSKGVQSGLANLQKLSEASAGALASTHLVGTAFNSPLGAEDQREFDRNLRDVIKERGISPFDIPGQIQARAEAWRRTNLPSAKVDLIPGKGIPLPGGHRLNEIQLGLKGATELVADPTNLIPFEAAAKLGVTAPLKGALRLGREIAPELTRTAEQAAKDITESARALRPRQLRANIPALDTKAIPGDEALQVPGTTSLAPPGVRQTPRLVLRPSQADALAKKWTEFQEKLPPIIKSVRDTPGLGPLSYVLNRVNPSVMLKPGDKLGLSRLVYIQQQTEAPSLVEAALLPLTSPVEGVLAFAAERGEQGVLGRVFRPEVPSIFKLSEDGKITNLAAKAPLAGEHADSADHWLNVFENAFVDEYKSGFAQKFNGRLVTELTPEEVSALVQAGVITQDFVNQAAYIKLVQDWFDEIGAMLNENNVPVSEVLLPEGGSYISRVVREINKIQTVVRSRRAGTEQPILKERLLLGGESLLRGMENGVRYENNPLAAFRTALESAYQSIRDTQLKNSLEEEARLSRDVYLAPAERIKLYSERDLKRAEDSLALLKRAQRGESLAGSSRGVILGLGEDIGGLLKEAFSFTGKRRKNALISARDIARKQLEDAQLVRKTVREIVASPARRAERERFAKRTVNLVPAQNTEAAVTQSLFEPTGGIGQTVHVSQIGEKPRLPMPVSTVFQSMGLSPGNIDGVFASKYPELTAALRRLFTGDLDKRITAQERGSLVAAINRDVQAITEIAKRTDQISKIAGRTEGSLLGKEREFLQKHAPALLAHVDEAVAADDKAARKTLFNDIQKAVEQLVEDRKALVKAATNTLEGRRHDLEHVRIETKGKNPLTNRHDVGEILLNGLESSTGKDLIIRESKELPFLRGLFFTEDELKRIESILPPGVKNEKNILEVAFLHAIPGVADTTRILKAGFDFGAPFLTGLPVLARRPDVWAKATARHFQVAFRGGDFHTLYLMKNIDVVREMAERNIPISGAATDYFLATQRGGALPKAGAFVQQGAARLTGENKAVLNLLNRAGRYGESLALRFENSFEAFGDYARIELYKAYRETALKQGDAGLDELAAFIRNATGAFHAGSIGVGPSQQAFERGWLWFSPRYTRASLALIGDAFQGGVRGAQARQTLLSMITGGAVVYYGMASALGQPVKLDPRPKSQGGDGAEFMTLNIAGQNVGIGSFWTSAVRLMASTIGDALDDPQTLAKPSTRDNPIVSWFRSRSAPTTGFITDAINGANFLGEPLDSPSAWVKHIGKQTLPFAVESAFFTDGPVGQRAFAFGSEETGLREFPVSNNEIRDRERELAARERFNKSWDELNGLQKKTLENDPNRDLGRLTQKSIEDARRFNPADPEGLDSKITEFFRLRDKIETEWRAEVQTGIDLFAQGTIDSVVFKERYLSPANSDRRLRLDDLNDNEKYREVLDYFKEQEDNRNLRPEDQAYAQYIDTIVTNDEFEGPLGFDFRAQDEAKKAFTEQWGDQMYAYVQARFEANRSTPDYAFPTLIEELYSGRERFKYYWSDVEDAVLAQERDPATTQALYEQYQNSTPTERNAMLEQSPVLKSFLNRMSKTRQELRKRNPELDAFLYRWGYTDTLAARENEWDDAEHFWRYSPAMSYPLPVQRVT